MYHAESFEMALFIREYMTTNYPDIDIFVVCNGFGYYSKTMRGLWGK
jgi:hypothetical protein